MAYITIGYKGETIAGISASGTTTLETAGKYCEDDITITFSGGAVTQDSSIYSFRQSTHNANLMRLKKIIGGTVAWNQIVPNANATFTSDNTDTRALNFYFRKDSSPYTSLYNKSNVQTGILSSIVSASFDGDIQIVHVGAVRNMYYVPRATISVQNGHKYLFSLNITGTDVSIVGGVTAKDIQIFDLTLMFGSIIADYIYALEQSNAGSGVAYFRKLFPKLFYEYNAGELLSVKTSAHKMVGFNQWDEEWELATINWTTYIFTPSATGGRLIPKNYIKVVSGATYYARLDRSITVMCGYTDDEGNGGRPITVDASTNLFTIPNDVRYIKFGVSTATYGTTYKNDICINISDASLNGTYQPYCVGNYALDGTIELRGLLKLDANNNLYYDGDEYTADGTVTRKYEYRAYASGDESLADAITDGTHTVAMLTTPTTESATPYIELQATFPNGTEEFVDARTVPMPVSQDAEYFINENS